MEGASAVGWARRRFVTRTSSVKSPALRPLSVRGTSTSATATRGAAPGRAGAVEAEGLRGGADVALEEVVALVPDSDDRWRPMRGGGGGLGAAAGSEGKDSSRASTGKRNTPWPNSRPKQL